MKKLSILLLAVLLVLSTVAGSIACGSDSSDSNADGVAGTYIDQEDASAYIEIEENGTFHAEDGGMEFNGEWEVEGDEIKFYWDDSVTTGTIEGDKIIESDGTVWIKQANGSEPATYTSSDIGAGGGTLEATASDGTTCSLTIQPDTLTEPINIKITAESSSKGSSLGSLSNDFRLEPVGLEFDTPVTISITAPNPLPADRVPAFLHTTAQCPGVLLETQVDGQTLSASLTHFSWISPVAPDAEELESYWYLVIQQEIDIHGVSVDRVRTLVSIYLHAQADNEVYGSIDLAEWENELWAHTNDLIIMGSLRCSSGYYEDAEYILKAARDIAELLLFTDLVAEAEQALEDCRNQPRGRIDINQTPDVLSGSGWSLTGPQEIIGTGSITLENMPPGDYTLVWNSVSGYVAPPSREKTLDADGRIIFNETYVEQTEGSFPVIYWRISEVGGTARIYLNDGSFDTVYSDDRNSDDTGWKGPLQETDGAGIPWVQEGADALVLTFKFQVSPRKLLPLQPPSAQFEIMVNGEIAISRQLEAAKGETSEETETLTFPGVLPPEE